jgi:hypothetical protein
MSYRKLHYLLVLALSFSVLTPHVLFSQITANETASIVGNIVRAHKQEWGVKAGKRLYTRDQIDRELDINLRTLYRIPNRGTSIAAAFTVVPEMATGFVDRFNVGFVLTNEGVYFRGGSGGFSSVTKFTYSELLYSYAFTWNSYYVFLYNKEDVDDVLKWPVQTINLLYADVAPPYVANLLESVAARMVGR